jgi:succinyl-CoA synthetase beta subunit
LRLYEYEGKELFRKYGIATPTGILAKTESAAREAAVQIGKEVVVKAQVLAGGRGKAGGIRVARNPEEAAAIARKLLDSEIQGFKVHNLLIEEKLDIAGELYLGITVDDSKAAIAAMVSTEGGVEIEEVARRLPERLASRLIDPLHGLRTYQAIDLLLQAGAKGEHLVSAGDMLTRLYDVFSRYDARFAEINPLVITSDGKMVAADARLEIDDHSLFRHRELRDLRIEHIENQWEREGVKAGVNYVDLEGSIAVMANGAGLTMAVMDMIKHDGASPACFVDTGGGLSQERMKNAVSLLLKKAQADPQIKVLLIMVRMMMSPPDAVAKGLMEAVNEVPERVPVIAVMRGRAPYENRARELLSNSGVRICSSVETGIKEAIAASRGQG